MILTDDFWNRALGGALMEIGGGLAGREVQGGDPRSAGGGYWAGLNQSTYGGQGQYAQNQELAKREEAIRASESAIAAASGQRRMMWLVGGGVVALVVLLLLMRK